MNQLTLQPRCEFTVERQLTIWPCSPFQIGFSVALPSLPVSLSLTLSQLFNASVRALVSSHLRTLTTFAHIFNLASSLPLSLFALHHLILIVKTYTIIWKWTIAIYTALRAPVRPRMKSSVEGFPQKNVLLSITSGQSWNGHRCRTQSISPTASCYSVTIQTSSQFDFCYILALSARSLLG